MTWQEVAKAGQDGASATRPREGWCGMVYSNFDTRMKGSCVIPQERFRKLRALEERLRKERAARRRAGAGNPD